MPRPRDDIHMRMPEAVCGIANAFYELWIKGRGVKGSDDLGTELDADIGTKTRRRLVQLRDHRLQRLKHVASEIDGEDHLFGNDVAAVGIDIDMADRTNRVRLILKGYFMNQLGDPRQGAPCIAAHIHRR